MELQKELKELTVSLPFFLAFSIVVMGVVALTRGFGWDLGFMGLGLLIGLPILDIDKVLVKHLEMPENFFHTFQIYILVFIMTVFVMTASASLFGKGMLMAILFHGFSSFKTQRELRIGAGLLGLAVLLLLL